MRFHKGNGNVLCIVAPRTTQKPEGLPLS